MQVVGIESSRSEDQNVSESSFALDFIGKNRQVVGEVLYI